ncbi:MAG TPA: hypothetical protein VNC39_10980 [Acidocella sp.]|jgi:hypothetical protein|uniref:hypothetical protein n=1 Tax=Acidocella sp. TaxID=50710 RepID=UPI002CE9CB2E|nr:hypothetical protein [Acidocella sp.]HVE22493.1 hypothetical protein [Acidocella sp.]
MNLKTEEALTQEIAKLEAQLSVLKLSLRGIKAGRASATARSQSVRNMKIHEKYLEAAGTDGTVARLAKEFTLSEKQIHRILKAQNAKGKPVPPSEVTPDRIPKRSRTPGPQSQQSELVTPSPAPKPKQRSTRRNAEPAMPAGQHEFDL